MTIAARQPRLPSALHELCKLLHLADQAGAARAIRHGDGGFPRRGRRRPDGMRKPFQVPRPPQGSQIFRFLKLIGCTNQQVGEFAKFVRRRNKIAHPTGNVFFNDQAAIDAEIAEMMKEVRNIEQHMEPVIFELYRRFLETSADIEEREYTDPNDEVTANFVHADYMSSADLAFCRQFDLAPLSDQVLYSGMLILQAALVALYPAEDTEEVA